jgi:hypothetical protein
MRTFRHRRGDRRQHRQADRGTNLLRGIEKTGRDALVAKGNAGRRSDGRSGKDEPHTESGQH